MIFLGAYSATDPGILISESVPRLKLLMVLTSCLDIYSLPAGFSGYKARKYPFKISKFTLVSNAILQPARRSGLVEEPEKYLELQVRWPS